MNLCQDQQDGAPAHQQVTRNATGFSVSYEGADFVGTSRKGLDDAFRGLVVEAARETAVEDSLDDPWRVDVKMDLDDGRTVDAVVVKDTDADASIEKWESRPSEMGPDLAT